VSEPSPDPTVAAAIRAAAPSEEAVIRHTWTSTARILAHRIPDSRLHIVTGGGHLFLLERPADMARHVAEFLHHHPDHTHPPAPNTDDDHEQDRGPR